MTRFGLWLTLWLLGCASTPQATGSTSASPVATKAKATTIGTDAPSTDAAPARAGQPPASKAFRECGGLSCKAFATASDAFDFVLADRPRVLAVGEAHTQGGNPGARSTVRRFMDGLLQKLAPRATDLVIELWLANGSCGTVEKQVAQQQRAVTAPQAASNQNDFIELGRRAKALGIQPQALVPTCEQYVNIANSGARDVEEMLRMIKVVTQRDIEALLAKRAPERLIVAYGGAMHNDLEPRAGREDFSFGPELSRATSNRYVELDLITPEQIKTHESWRNLPWYPHYSPANGGTETYLYSWAPHAYALIFATAATNEGAP